MGAVFLHLTLSLLKKGRAYNLASMEAAEARTQAQPAGWDMGACQAKVCIVYVLVIENSV